MMTGELLRIIDQLGGAVRLGASGGLVLAGIDVKDLLRNKILAVIKQRCHRDEIGRRLTRGPFTREDIERKLDAAIKAEAALDLFGPGDTEYDLICDLHKAVMRAEKENEAVDAMRVDFDSLIPAPIGQNVSLPNVA